MGCKARSGRDRNIGKVRNVGKVHNRWDSHDPCPANPLPVKGADIVGMRESSALAVF